MSVEKMIENMSYRKKLPAEFKTDQDLYFACHNITRSLKVIEILNNVVVGNKSNSYELITWFY